MSSATAAFIIEFVLATRAANFGSITIVLACSCANESSYPSSRSSIFSFLFRLSFLPDSAAAFLAETHSCTCNPAAISRSTWRRAFTKLYSILFSSPRCSAAGDDPQPVSSSSRGCNFSLVLLSPRHPKFFVRCNHFDLAFSLILPSQFLSPGLAVGSVSVGPLSFELL